MLLKKSNKKLKKLMALMRLRRVQLIMQAIKTHQKVTLNTVKPGRGARTSYANVGRAMVKKRVTTTKGRIATSKKRSRDLWQGKLK